MTKRQFDKEDQIKNKPIKLSPSTLILFHDCPRCFWLTINEGIRRPRGPYPSLPTGMDSIIKKYFNQYRENETLPPFLKEKVKGLLAKDMPKTLYYHDNFGNVLYGRPDEYLNIGDYFFAALDHKTRASAPYEIHPSYLIQMDCYTFLLESNEYKTKNLGYLVYYFPMPSEIHKGINFETEIKEIETNPERAIELFNKAKKLLKAPLPESVEECEYCQWFNNIYNLK